MKLLALTAALFAVTTARDAITVDPDENGGSGIDWKQFEYKNEYCELSDRKCARGRLIMSFHAVEAPQCIFKCNKDSSCASAFYGRDKTCFLREERCDVRQLTGGRGGTDFYRLKKGEECPDDRPQYEGPEVTYSNKFCMMRDMKCHGHDLYKKPQKIETMMGCLRKCQKLRTCASVDFTPFRCRPKSYHCEDAELGASRGTLNFQRLEEGVPECAPNRENPTTDPAPTQEVCEENAERNQAGNCVCKAGFERFNQLCLPACAENQKRHDDGECRCSEGFEVVKGQCEKACPTFGWRGWSGKCICQLGREMVNDQCLPACPPNSERTGQTGCQCKGGFERFNGLCLPACIANSKRNFLGVCACEAGFELMGTACVNECGANSRRQGLTCVCQSGFDSVNGQCLENCPSNAYRTGVTCTCRQGYQMIGHSCLTDCPANGHRVGLTCVCNSGYEMVNGHCLAGCPVNSYRRGIVCLCNQGYEMDNNQCVKKYEIDARCTHAPNTSGCYFPFEYKGLKYSSCTRAFLPGRDWHRCWCGTKKDRPATDFYDGTWQHCE